MVLAQKIFRLDSGETKHFRNLKQSQGLLAIAFESQSLQGAAGEVLTCRGKPLGHIVRNMERNFHRLTLACVGSFRHPPVHLQAHTRH